MVTRPSTTWWNGTKPTGALVIPGSVTYSGAVYNVTSIGESAFKDCTGLTSVTIPNSVTSIGNYAFHSCSGLTSITIPNSVTSLSDGAFYGCSELTSITIPDSVTSIGSLAFSGCSGLTSVTIPNSVTSIDDGAFQGCSGLTSVSIGSGVTSIGQSTFRGCSGLTSITIGSGVTSIGSMAFENCSNLDTVYMMPPTPPSLGTNAFYSNASGRVFIIAGCGYDNYYNVDSSDRWYNLRNYLRRQTININVNVQSSNTARGTASVVLGPNNEVVRCDSTVVVQATANTGYHFDHWSNGSTANPANITLTSDSTVTAYFERNSYNLTVNVNDATLGTVTTPDGTNALYGDTLTVVATHIEHYHVASWQGQGIVATSADKDTVRVSMNSNRTLTCNFAIDTHTVAVTSNDIARGSVSATGTEFAYGSPCTVSATAYTGYTFQSWSNGVTANPYTFAVMEDVELTAIFVVPGEETYTVTVSVNDPAMGSATVNGNTTATVTGGSEVTLTATPNAGYRFVRWNDDNTEETRTVTVTADMSFTAYFESDGTQGIEDIETPEVAIVINGNTLTVQNPDRETIRIFDCIGRQIATSNLSLFNYHFSTSSGVYFVKVGILPSKKIVVVK